MVEVLKASVAKLLTVEVRSARLRVALALYAGFLSGAGLMAFILLLPRMLGILELVRNACIGGI